MKLYLAGLYTSNFGGNHGVKTMNLTPKEDASRTGVRHMLESYHYIHKQSMVDKIRRDGCKLFLDSGAFSAFTQGVEIDLPGYCDYIKRNEDIIEKVDDNLMASVLDGIGDPYKTWQNQAAMERLGVRPLPCFHYGEDERYLDWYVANYDYITLGGMVPISTPQLLHWLDRIWEEHLTDGSGRPKIKVHGFGLTSLDLMMRYPWFSVDSSSWVQIAAHGSVFLWWNGRTLAFSSQHPARKMEGMHYLNIPEIHQKAIADKLAEDGFEAERFITNNYARWAYNCFSFTRIMDEINKYPAVFQFAKQERLF